MIEQGGTVVVIEYNQPAPAKAGVIKTADWVLNLGPEGGVSVERSSRRERRMRSRRRRRA